MRIDELKPTPTAAAPLDIPTELMASVQRHQTHLSALIASLRAAGVSDTVVESSIRTLVDSYADDLTIAVRAMMKAPGHA